MPQAVRALVTGMGGDLGQALVKALRLSNKLIECHGCDMDGAGVGAAFVDSFQVVPQANDPTYVSALKTLCDTRGIDVVVPGSEPEIAVLSRLGHPPRLPSGIPVVSQEREWLETYGDKLACLQALSGKIELPPFTDGVDRQAVATFIEQAGFPVVVKSRCSSGSRSLRVAHNPAELDAALRATPLPLVQAFLDDSGGEFSVGMFACDHFSSAIAFRRQLGSSGCSWFAETSMDEAVLDYAMTIARITGLRGSANIQVRKTSKGVQLLEINPRFSSLVAARAACGFRDVEWAVELALGRIPDRPDGRFKHLRFRRFFHELVDFGDGFNAATEWLPRGAPISSQLVRCDAK